MSAPKTARSAAFSDPAATFPAPNSYPQLARWVLEPQIPQNAAHNYPIPLRVRGRLNPETLAAALRALLQRHEALRSTFHLDSGMLAHSIAPADLALVTHDLTNLPSGDAENAARTAILALCVQPFKMAEEIPIRAFLFHLRQDDHILLLVTHHAACDDWSVGILLRELVAFYSLGVRGAPLHLQALAPSYSQFVADLGSRAASADWRRQRDFWTQYLAGAGDFHHLVPDRPRSSHPASDGAHAIWRGSEHFAESLRRVAIREQVSPFMVLLAALQCVLARESGVNDIGVGACVANRTYAGAQDLVGPLSNRIVLRTDLSGDPTLRDVLRRVRSSSLDAYSHQELPFGEIVEAVAKHASNGRNPLFQTLIVQKENPLAGVHCPHFHLEWFDVDPGVTRYDLNVWAQFKPGDGLEIDFQYNSGLFSRNTIERLRRNYEAFLVSLVQDVNVRLCQISLAARRELPSAAPATDRLPATAASTDHATIVVAGLFETILGIKPVGPSSDFFELGGTSLQAAQLFAGIQQKFNVILPFSSLLHARTPGQLAALLRKDRPRDATSSLVAVQPRGVKPPLLCVHSHRGDILFCGPLSRNLGTDQPVFAFQSRGLAASPLFTVERIADSYVDELLAAKLPEPYLLFGYSFGGLVAFEMAARLAAKGLHVAFLAMFNTPAPGSLTRWPLGQPSYLRKKTGHAIATLHDLNENQRIAHFSKKLSNFTQLLLGSLRTDLWRVAAALTNRSWMERLGKRILNVGQINIAAAKEYHPRTLFAGRITFLISRRFPYLYSISPHEGWSRFATEGVNVVEIPDSEQVPFDLAMSQTLESEIRAAAGLIDDSQPSVR